MGFIKFSKYQGLHRLNFTNLVEDTSVNSPDYFRISQFPEKLTCGKNAFLIAGNSDMFAPNTQIKFECVDISGKPVYIEIPSWIDGSGNRMISLWVYPWTPIGNGMITLVAKLRKGGMVRWKRMIQIDPYAPNRTEVVFGKKPKIFVQEKRREYLNPQYPIGDTAETTYSTGQISIDWSMGSAGAMEAIATITGGTFTSAHEGGHLVITSPNYTLETTTGPYGSATPTLDSLTPSGEDNTNQSYDGYITEVINDTTARLNHPFELANVTINSYWGNWPQPTYQVDVEPSNFTLDYIQTSTYGTGSGNWESYALVTISNLAPIAGDAEKIVTYMRSAGFTEWEKIGDDSLNHKELFIDGDSNELTKKMGYFVDQYTLDTYWSASAHGYDNSGTYPSMSIASSSLMDALRISGSEQLGDGNYSRAEAYIRVENNIPVQFYEGNDYQISFKFSKYTDLFDGYPPELVVYMSGSSFDNIDQNGLKTLSTLGKKITTIGEENTYSTWVEQVSQIQNDPNFIPGVGIAAAYQSAPMDMMMIANNPGGAAAGPSFAGTTATMAQVQESSKNFWSQAGANIVPDPETQTYSFTADRDGTGVPVFQIKAGRWDISKISIKAVALPGYTPNHTFLLSHIPSEKINDLLDFKWEFYDGQGNKNNTYLVTHSMNFSGSNTYIEEALLPGTFAIGPNEADVGFEFSGVSSAVIRTMNPTFPGFTKATGSGGGGIIIWSGSLSDSGKSYENSGSYYGVGMELVGSSSWLRFRTQTGSDSGAGGELDITTDKFFLGSPLQYISGSSGNIEISSSNFWLQNDGDIIMQGTITATAGGTIGGATINSHSLAFGTIWEISASSNTSDPASFISSSTFKVSAGGQATASNLLLEGGIIDASPYWKIDRATDTSAGGFISSSNFKVSPAGAVTASDIRLEGGVIESTPYWKIDRSTDNTDPGSFISSSLFKVRADGTVTASAILLNQGTLDNPPHWKIDNRTDAQVAGFISSSGFKVSATGVMTASSGQIGGWKIDGDSLLSTGFTDISTGDGIRLLGDSQPKIYVQQSSADDQVIIYYTNDSSWGLSGIQSGTDIFQLGSTNQIAGWTFNSEKLTGGALTLNKSGFISSSNWHISSSTADSDPTGFISSSAFKVSPDGRVTASAATIEGKITATSGEIAGWDIDGNILKSGTNIQLDSGNKKITINDQTFGNTGIQLDYDSGTPRAFIGKSDGGFLKYESGDIHISASKFFMGGGEQYISGSSGLIEISSSKFHLSSSGDVVMQGTVTATAGNIAGWIVNTDSLTGGNLNLSKDGTISSSTWQISSSTADSDPGGFISSSAFKVSADGRITASEGQIAGATIGATSLAYDPYWKIQSSTATTPGSFISSSQFKVSADGTATASNLLVTGDSSFGGVVQNLPHWKIDNQTDTAEPDGFISSSQFKVSADGRITGSQVYFIGGTLGGWTINAGSISDGDLGTMIIHKSGYIKSDDWQISSSRDNNDPAGFISSSDFKLSADGRISASAGKIGGFTIGPNTFTATNFTIDPSNQKVSLGDTTGDAVFIAAADSGIQLGHNSFASAPFSVTTAGVLKATSGEIAGWTIDSEKFTGTNVTISSSGEIKTSNFVSSMVGGLAGAGYRIGADGIAEFEEARIRGTLSTAVFEKETVSAVGGALIVANATAIKSGSIILSSSLVGHTTPSSSFSVDNASGFAVGEYVLAKATSSNGFTEEIMKIASVDTTNNILVMSRSMRGNLIESMSSGQVLVSQGQNGTGFILLNATSGSETPYIDITERTGTGVDDLAVKVRLGDLSGISDATMPSVAGFGLYTDNVFLKGTISSSAGNIGGIDIGASRLRYQDLWEISSSADTNDPAGFISSSNFKVRADGVMTASGVNISGNLNAQTGTIGGFTIGSSALTTAVFQISSSQNTSDPASFISASNFKVSAGGQMTASNAKITGEITADSGEIGGWKISNTSIHSTGLSSDFSSGTGIGLDGDGTPRIKIVGDGTDNYVQLSYASNNWGLVGYNGSGNLVFGLGNPLDEGNQIAGWTFDTEKLSGGALTLNKSGFISSSNWHISSSTSNADPIGFISSSDFKVSADGRMTASAGKIGGWTINSDHLVDSNNRLKLEPSGDYIISSSDFKVSAEGEMTASAGQIGGWIISSGDLKSTNYDTAQGIKLTTGADPEILMKAHIASDDYIRLHSAATTDWGISGWIGGEKYFYLGDHNFIAGWTFTTTAFDGGNMHLNKEGFISSSGATQWKISSSADTTDPAGFISSSAFKVSADGRVTGSQVMFSGGKIAGWTISENEIYYDKVHIKQSDQSIYVVPGGSGNNVNRINLGQTFKASSYTGEYGIAAIDGNDNYVFRLTDGAREIAGWSFDNEQLSSGDLVLNKAGWISGSTKWHISSSTTNSDPVGFISSSDFKISADGRVTASSALITGNSVFEGTLTIGSQATLPSDEYLIAHYPLHNSIISENGFVRVLDVSGNGYHSPDTVNGCQNTDFISGSAGGPTGGCVDFDGDASAQPIYITAAAAGFTSNMDISVSLWFQDNTTAEDQSLFGFHDGGQNDFVVTINHGGNNNRVELTVNSNQCGTIDVSTDYEFTNNWRHMVIVAEDGEQGKLYIDGVYQGAFGVQTVETVDIDEVDEMLIGGELDSAGGASTDNVDGKISGFRIYNKVLTSSEIQGLFLNPGGNIGNTKIEGDKITTGKIHSSNWSAASGSQFDLDAGTIKMGGSESSSFAVNARGDVTASNLLLDGYAAAQALRTIPIVITANNHHQFISQSITSETTPVSTIYLDGSYTGSSPQTLSPPGTYPDRITTHVILDLKAIEHSSRDVGAIVNIVPPKLPGGETVNIQMEVSASAQVELCIEQDNETSAFGYAWNAMQGVAAASRGAGGM